MSSVAVVVMNCFCSLEILSAGTMVHVLEETVTGKLQKRLCGTPQVFPSDHTPKLTQSCVCPPNQLFMCAMAALPAEAALDIPLASMISAPRFCTFGMKVVLYHCSPTRSSAGLFSIVAHVRSGNIVGEWLPQITTLAMSCTDLPVRQASSHTALSWSSLDIAAKFYLGSPLAWVAAMRQLVLAGFPTTKILASLLACSPNALPCSTKILAFSIRRSLRYCPLDLGLAPTKMAASMSLKPVLRLSVQCTWCRRGKAQSPNSIATPDNAFWAMGRSIRLRITGWCGPKMSPWAMRNRREQQICPAAPVTATRIGFVTLDCTT